MGLVACFVTVASGCDYFAGRPARKIACIPKSHDLGNHAITPATKTATTTAALDLNGSDHRICCATGVFLLVLLWIEPPFNLRVQYQRRSKSNRP